MKYVTPCNLVGGRNSVKINDGGRCEGHSFGELSMRTEVKDDWKD